VCRPGLYSAQSTVACVVCPSGYATPVPHAAGATLCILNATVVQSESTAFSANSSAGALPSPTSNDDDDDLLLIAVIVILAVLLLLAVAYACCGQTKPTSTSAENVATKEEKEHAQFYPPPHAPARPSEVQNVAYEHNPLNDLPPAPAALQPSALGNPPPYQELPSDKERSIQSVPARWQAAVAKARVTAQEKPAYNSAVKSKWGPDWLHEEALLSDQPVRTSSGVKDKSRKSVEGLFESVDTDGCVFDVTDLL
jgi:hypothetical protein